jgi:di/tricarboxylate transporter
MIPLGEALEASGGTALIAQTILGVSAGASPVLVLTLLIVAVSVPTLLHVWPL